MVPAADNDALKTEELTAIIRAVQDRVRARYPAPDSAKLQMEIALPDLLPLVHARDAAEAKVAAIGTVNPRPGGPLNRAIQWAKRIIARSLDWFVREQVVFNRETMACVQASLEALNEVNRVLVALAHQTSALHRDAEELKDMRAHWAEWRTDWERKLSLNEIQFLRSVADLQGAFQHRATLMEANFRDIAKSQHADYLGALERATLDSQKNLWADLERIRLEYERLIHTELRIVRQRAAQMAERGGPAPPVPESPAHSPQPAFDYARFAERFRGSENYVQAGQQFYLPHFAGCKEVLDVGCGRGEFLELLREAGVPARGIDLSRESVDLCRRKGLQAETADLFVYLDSLPDSSLDGVFCAQVVEHLPPERIPEMIRLAARKLARGGLLAIETPNPECLAIFASHFYLDPTHTRPVPAPLLSFYMEEYGLGGVQVHQLSPAVESMPALAELPEVFRNAFFGALDYAILGRKLA